MVGPFGSTQVDNCFLKLIYDLIGSEASAELERRLDVRLDLLAVWENVKLQSSPLTQRNTVVQAVCLQNEILNALNLNLRSLVEAYQLRNPGHLGIKGDTRLELSPLCIQEIFSESINLIVETTDSYMTNTRAGEAGYILLAGGYSQSPFVWNAIVDNFGDETRKIFRVSKPDTAIVRGAAIYGTGHKTLVTHRISKVTYGIKTMFRYDATIADHVRRQNQISYDDAGFPYIPGVTVTVPQGQEIPSGFKSSPCYCRPLIEAQRHIRFQVLLSDHPLVIFADEAGVKILAHFDVPLNMDLPFDERVLEVEVQYTIYFLYPSLVIIMFFSLNLEEPK